MLIVRKPSAMQKLSEGFRKKGKKIGFVPTMGYLHQGHIKLMKESVKISDLTVVSIFVNPIQFGPSEDYATYPRDEKRDIEICRETKVDVVFIPQVRDIYPKNFQTFVEVKELQNHLCGLSRPGHFRGVATVVAKLFNIVKPHYAFFGLKDYQQTLVIKRMVEDLNFDLKIVTLPTVREKDGLAMSSRNSYLDEEERKIALAIPHSLKMAKELFAREKSAKVIENKLTKFLEDKKVKVDYVKVSDAITLEDIDSLEEAKKVLVAVAGFVGKTRLIDSIVLQRR